MATIKLTREQLKNATNIFQLKIWLVDIEPRIWREFAAAGSIRLDRLHQVIQEIMGWTDSHLHAFAAGERRYSAPYPGGDWDEDMLDEGGTAVLEEAGARHLRFVGSLRGPSPTETPRPLRAGLPH